MWGGLAPASYPSSPYECTVPCRAYWYSFCRVFFHRTTDRSTQHCTTIFSCWAELGLISHGLIRLHRQVLIVSGPDPNPFAAPGGLPRLDFDRCYAQSSVPSRLANDFFDSICIGLSRGCSNKAATLTCNLIFVRRCVLLIGPATSSSLVSILVADCPSFNLKGKQ